MKQMCMSKYWHTKWRNKQGNGEGTTHHAEGTNYCYVTTVVIAAGNLWLKLVGKILTPVRYLHNIKVSSKNIY